MFSYNMMHIPINNTSIILLLHYYEYDNGMTICVLFCIIVAYLYINKY